jgi:hypothetical protein
MLGSSAGLLLVAVVNAAQDAPPASDISGDDHLADRLADSPPA